MDTHRGRRSINQNNFTQSRKYPGNNDMNLAENNEDQIAYQDNPTAEQQPPSPNPQQAQYMGGYSMIAPNESRRSKLQTMAKKEEEDLKRWKEINRPGPLNLPPTQLGGAVSIEEARQKQMLGLRQSKYQRKLKQEEFERKRKEAEEAEIQKKKDMQREKAIKLQEMKQKQEMERRQKLQYDHNVTTHQFLQRIETSNSAQTAKHSSPPVSSWAKVHAYREAQKEEEEAQLTQKKEEQRTKSKLLEEKQKREEEERKRELQSDHRQVNAAFLDRIQGNVQSGRKELVFPVGVAEGRAPCASAPQDAPTSPGPGLDWNEGEGGHDLEWTVMKLLNRFPMYERTFIEDIVTQCNGDYNQVCSLLQ
ncbi:epithelial-stromal interaction protein 1 [Amia ocellicauda]|uniref:epithelial-stromal interaction protein 1 n=1 Tax=Amia ocellicauda TaxID=2972642 RepID=UPI0034644E8A